MTPILALLASLNPDAAVYDEHENELVGIAEALGQDGSPTWVAVYDRQAIVRKLAGELGDYDEAEDYVGFNIDSLWCGPATPFLLVRRTDSDLDDEELEAVERSFPGIPLGGMAGRCSEDFRPAFFDRDLGGRSLSREFLAIRTA